MHTRNTQERVYEENGTVISTRTQTYGTSIVYPSAEMEGHSLAGWRTSEDIRNTTTVPAADTVFYPVFTPRPYNVIIMHKENELGSKVFLCGEAIDLAVLGNEFLGGFDVRGWYMDANHSVKIEGENIPMPGHNVTLFPKIVSNRVEIVFGSGELNKNKATEIIKRYTDDSFVIEAFERFEDETVVIIRFEDAGEAMKFVGAVESSSGSTTVIKKCSFNFGKLESFVRAGHPLAQGISWIIIFCTSLKIVKVF